MSLRKPRLFAGGGSQPDATNAPFITVHDVLEWFRLRFPGGKSVIADAERWRILELFDAQYGPIPYDSLTGDDLEDFTAKNGKPHKAGNTVDRWYRTVKRPFKAAAKRRKIEFCPFDGISSPRGAEGRDLTPQEFRTLLRNANPPFRRVLVFLRFSGCRPGELRALEWPNILDELAMLREHKTLHSTGVPRRIWFNSVTLKLLAWLKRNSKSSFVFVNSFGGAWTTRALCKNLATIRTKAGLPRDVRNYGCRHLFGTDAIVNGCDLATVMELMGHRSLGTTRRYLHLASKNEHMRNGAEQAIHRATSRNS